MFGLRLIGEEEGERTQDLGALVDLYDACFDEPFGETGFGALLASPGMLGLFAVPSEAVEPNTAPVGFILVRCAADEAEIVSLGVEPKRRRQGVAAALLAEAMRRTVELGAERIFLEVAEDNEAAIALYSGAGFAPVGRRAAYYRRKTSAPIDALIMRYIVKKSVSCWKY